MYYTFLALSKVLKERFFFHLQFRYKSRVYQQPNVNEKQIAKIHTQVRKIHSIYFRFFQDVQ